MEEVKSSPIPTNFGVNKILNFFDALKELAQGKKITRLGWEDPNEFGFLNNDRVCIKTKGEVHTWVIAKEDLVGIDWVVVSEKLETGTVIN